MEKQAKYTITSPGYQQFHLRLPTAVYQWLRQTAAENRRSMTSEAILALEAWRLSSGISISDAKKLYEFTDTERQETIRTLRGLCKDFGDNNWPDNLHLGDVIEKHLGKYLVDNPIPIFSYRYDEEGNIKND